MPGTHIYYLFAEDQTPGDPWHTVFHVLSQSEARLLRCFMAMLYLPTSVSGMVSEKRPFNEALVRLHDVPRFRKANSSAPLPEPLWHHLLKLPLLVLMVGNKLPIWLNDLAAARPIVLLSPNEATIETALRSNVISAGLLRDPDDIREFYRIFRDLCRVSGQDRRLSDETREKLTALSDLDLFECRSRLDFFPAFPLPQPWNGRAAAYLLNRMSNNVDSPSLRPDQVEGGEIRFPKLLLASLRAVATLAFFELGERLPEPLQMSVKEIEEVHSTLLSTQVDSNQKFAAMLELGSRVAHMRLDRLFITIPVVRSDLVRGRVPGSVKPAPDHKRMAKSGIQALNDFIEGIERKHFGSIDEKQAYGQAYDTLLLEQRFLACQTACLASRSLAIPLQLRSVPGDMHNRIRDLNQAIKTNSRKCTKLFREVEQGLSDVLPSAVREWLCIGDSPVVLFSDLPFEWALIDDWPLCLTRPVSRIPTGLSQWDALNMTLEAQISINSRTPGKVLVLDLIAQDDPIRIHSDIFISTSEELSQNYIYAKPANAAEFRDIIERTSPEIVVLDSHGRYDQSKDEVWINLPDGPASVDQLLPDTQVPPVWILSACDTSVTGAMRGCFVRRLLYRGAVCVIASLASVDALTASIFVGRLLTAIFNPNQPNQHRSLDQVIFSTQLTTALLYDPLLPLIRKSEKDAVLRKALGNVLGDYLGWAAHTFLEVRQFRHTAAWVLGESMARHGLTKTYVEALLAGSVRPETLLFSAFGVPSRVELSA